MPRQNKAKRRKGRKRRQEQTVDLEIQEQLRLQRAQRAAAAESKQSEAIGNERYLPIQMGEYVYNEEKQTYFHRSRVPSVFERKPASTDKPVLVGPNRRRPIPFQYAEFCPNTSQRLRVAAQWHGRSLAASMLMFLSPWTRDDKVERSDSFLRQFDVSERYPLFLRRNGTIGYFSGNTHPLPNATFVKRALTDRDIEFLVAASTSETSTDLYCLPTCCPGVIHSNHAGLVNDIDFIGTTMVICGEVQNNRSVVELNNSYDPDPNLSRKVLLPGRPSGVLCVHAHENQVVCGRRDGSIFQFDIRTRQKPSRVHTDDDNIVRLTSLRHRTNQILYQNQRGSVALIDSRMTKQPLHVFFKDKVKCGCIGFATDPSESSVILPFCAQGTAKLGIFSLDSGEQTATRDLGLDQVELPPRCTPAYDTKYQHDQVPYGQPDILPGKFGLWADAGEQGVHHIHLDGRFT